MSDGIQRPLFHYTFAAHEDEAELCAMEQRRLFGCEAGPEGLLTGREVGPDRSPFMRTRLDVLHTARDLGELAEAVAAHASLESSLHKPSPPVHAMPDIAPVEPDSERQAEAAGAYAPVVVPLLEPGQTFKIVCLRGGGLSHGERRLAERRIGAVVAGAAEMKAPDRLFGAARLPDGRWLFGRLAEAGAGWLRHQSKPRQYSTALGVRAARAIANIAVPDPVPGKRAVDPCCGIGTVLLEALSIGIRIEGFDLNPLAVRGARENLRHFGYPPELVSIADMRAIGGRYDAAVLDLPYNKCSVLPADTLAEMLASLRRLAGDAVIVTVEDVDDAVQDAGFRIEDRCSLSKGAFSRQVLFCT